MEKNRLLLFPFLVGLILMVYSGYLSYPLLIDSVDDLVYNHVSILYWFSQSLLLASMFMMAMTSKNNYLKGIISVGILVTIYSISYFYYMLPSPDSQYFRGLTEYFIETRKLDPAQPNHQYYQWPSFFILSYITTSVSGLTLANFEFLLYALIGFLLATTLYVYASKAYKNGGFLAVPAFLVSMFNILNYQCVPFSLALVLLLLMFTLETRQKSIGLTITILVLFTSISITHAFVPLFFILYLLIRSIFSRSRQYGNLFLFTLITYFLVQFTQAQYSFAQNIMTVLSFSSEMGAMVEVTVATPVSVPIDVIAQMFSRTVTVVFPVVCVAGFVFLLIKRKMRPLDKALLLMGAAWSGLGILLYTLGSRSIPIAFIPISLGAAYLFESRLRPYIKYIFLVLLILFPFIPLHHSFTNNIQFQTRETYIAQNFFVNYYSGEKPSSILANFFVITYLQSKLSAEAYFNASTHEVKKVDTIFYTLGLGKDFLGEDYTMERLFQEERLNVVYDNSFSYIAIKAQP